jgi:hypothetical protein
MPTKQKQPVRDSGINDAADELELSEDTVRRDIRRGCPHSRKNNRILLNIPEYREWRAEQGLTGERGRPIEGDSPDLERARLRKENALAAKYELQVKRERAELIPAEEVRQFLGEMLMVFRNTRVGFGAAVVPHLQGRDPAEQQALIDQREEESFSNLAKALADHFGGTPLA